MRTDPRGLRRKPCRMSVDRDGRFPRPTATTPPSRRRGRRGRAARGQIRRRKHIAGSNREPVGGEAGDPRLARRPCHEARAPWWPPDVVRVHGPSLKSRVRDCTKSVPVPARTKRPSGIWPDSAPSATRVSSDWCANALPPSRVFERDARRAGGRSPSSVVPEHTLARDATRVTGKVRPAVGIDVAFLLPVRADEKRVGSIFLTGRSPAKRATARHPSRPRADWLNRNSRFASLPGRRDSRLTTPAWALAPKTADAPASQDFNSVEIHRRDLHQRESARMIKVERHAVGEHPRVVARQALRCAPSRSPAPAMWSARASR